MFNRRSSSHLHTAHMSLGIINSSCVDDTTIKNRFETQGAIIPQYTALNELELGGTQI